MKNSILTVTLNPVLDRFVPLSRLITSKTFDKRFGRISAGGKGINVARTLKCLNIPTVAIGITGGRSGEKIRVLLNKEEIPHNFVLIPEESRTNITLGDPLGGSQLRIKSIGPMVDDQTLGRFERVLIKKLSRCSMVCLSGKNITGAPSDYYSHLIKLIKRKGKAVVLDINGEELRWAIKTKPLIIKPNLMEAQEALGRRISTLKNAKEAVRSFQRMGIPIVLLTLGLKGALGIFRDQLWFSSPPKIKINQSIGCGDAFLGGFLCAYYKKISFPQVLRFATSCGTISALGNVPGEVNKNDVIRFEKSIQLRQL